MKITEDTKVSEVLDRYPRLLEVLAAYHPHFERLRNKVLRKVMAPRVNLEQAARMAKVDLRALLATLNRAIGEEPEEVAGVSSKKASPRPPELQGLREESMVAIYKGEEGVSKAEGARAPSREGLRPQEGLVTLDVRGLSPPEPMMKVL
ncbi:MAG: DUF1858 domain-containing protein, partial [candidate division NC10 bacterium]|nr:DUF1858 domain-containing protein [candidate division NC10 bacterium]